MEKRGDIDPEHTPTDDAGRDVEGLDDGFAKEAADEVARKLKARNDLRDEILRARERRG